MSPLEEVSSVEEAEQLLEVADPSDRFLGLGALDPRVVVDNEDKEEKAVAVYESWLDLAGMPIRSTIRNCLLDHSLLWGVERGWEGPEVLSDTFRSGNGKKHKEVKEAEF